MQNEQDVDVKKSNAKKYIGCKIILAEPMHQNDWLILQGKNVDPNAETLGDGYKVIYPDGYTSWSPKNVFETAYREITIGELALINS